MKPFFLVLNFENLISKNHLNVLPVSLVFGCFQLYRLLCAPLASFLSSKNQTFRGMHWCSTRVEWYITFCDFFKRALFCRSGIGEFGRSRAWRMRVKVFTFKNAYRDLKWIICVWTVANTSLLPQRTIAKNLNF